MGILYPPGYLVVDIKYTAYVWNVLLSLNLKINFHYDLYLLSDIFWLRRTDIFVVYFLLSYGMFYVVFGLCKHNNYY